MGLCKAGDPVSAAPEEKMTAERLIAIADEAGAAYKDGVVAACKSAFTTMFSALKQAKDEGMDGDLAVIVLMRLAKALDGSNEAVQAAMDELGKEAGLE